MRNRNLIDLWSVLGKIKDVSLLDTNKNIEIIKNSEIDISDTLRFVFDMNIDSSELNQVIDILGLTIANVKDEKECIRILKLIDKRIRTWYKCLEPYTFDSVIYDLEVCMRNYNKNMLKIDEYINVISVIDTLQQESFYLDNNLCEVRGFRTNEYGQRAFSFIVHPKEDDYISIIVVKDDKVIWHKAKDIKTLDDKKKLLEQIINDGYELMILSSSDKEEDTIRNQLLIGG